MIIDLHKNVNYRILKSDDENKPILSGGDGTKISEYSVIENSAKESDGVIAYCDERIPLYDGKMLIRLRNTLTVAEA